MTAVGALFEQIRAIAALPKNDSPDPFLKLEFAKQQIARAVEMETLMARARAVGAQPPADVVELLAIAAARKEKAIEVRAATEQRIARIAAGSKYVVDGIERLEAYTNRRR